MWKHLQAGQNRNSAEIQTPLKGSLWLLDKLENFRQDTHLSLHATQGLHRREFERGLLQSFKHVQLLDWDFLKKVRLGGGKERERRGHEITNGSLR